MQIGSVFASQRVDIIFAMELSVPKPKEALVLVAAFVIMH